MTIACYSGAQALPFVVLPLLTVMETVEPGATPDPAAGLCPSTIPGSLQPGCRIGLATRPTAEISWIAVFWASVVTLGTVTLPVDSVRFTPEPGNSMVGADGSWAVTEPCGDVPYAEETREREYPEAARV